MDNIFFIITGLSGAGKSLALRALEDIGFFCIDNMPTILILKLLELKEEFFSHNKKVACAVDIRNSDVSEELLQVLKKMQEDHLTQIIFLDANDKVLRDRYKETRRKHPVMLQKGLSLEDALKYERDALIPIFTQADYILDTSLLSTSQLKDRIVSFAIPDVRQTMSVDVISFGFKFGTPTDADLIFDVRCLLNPFYIPELKEKDGYDPEIIRFVFTENEAKVLFEKYTDLISYSLPLYVKEGKSHITIAFGCTGGKHRSVAFCNAVCQHIKSEGYNVSSHHRDIKRGR